MQPRFSLIIVTVSGREHLLSACLDSVERQEFKDLEAIIVDQASDPCIKEIVDVYPWTRYVAAPSDGLSASRNLGLRLARGMLVAFPDDDATLAPDMLAQADRIFKAYPDLGLLSGSAIDPRTMRRIFRFPSAPTMLSVWNVMQRHSSITLVIKRRTIEAESEPFDPMLGVGTRTPFGGSEETDLVLRLLLTGISARYEPDVVVYHPNSDLAAIPRAKVILYGAGLGACFRKNRDRFGWWPVGAVWSGVLVRACGGVILDILHGRFAHANQRRVSLQARIRGWRLYGKWLANTHAVQPMRSFRRMHISVDARDSNRETE